MNTSVLATRLRLVASAILLFVFTGTMSASAVAAGPRLGAFWLVDAETDFLFNRLYFDDLVDLNHAPESLSIRADAEGSVGSVVFTFDGEVVQTENKAPYAIGKRLPTVVRMELEKRGPLQSLRSRLVDQTLTSIVCLIRMMKILVMVNAQTFKIDVL